MKILVMATGGFAVPAMRWLVKSDHDILGLISRPVRPHRSRTAAAPSPAVSFALAAGIHVETPASVNDPAFHPWLRERKLDLLFVCDYGEILSAGTLSIPSKGGINLHGSLLPQYRGAAPVAWAILDGQTETGVSVIHMSPKLDAGPILAQLKLSITPTETSGELEQRLAELGVAAVQDALSKLAVWDGNSPIGVPQDRQAATKARRLRREDGAIEWRRSSRQIVNQVRALQPWPSAYTLLNVPGAPPVQLQILAAHSLGEIENTDKPTPGRILTNVDGEFCVATLDGVLQLDLVRPENRKTMSGRAFLAGHRLTPGTYLGS